jgi:hypothetical protein
MNIKKNKIPMLKRPEFTVDGKLNEKLDDIEIFKLMNKAHFSLFLGKAGSGKSSLIISLLNSKRNESFKKVFHDIIIFIPPNSRQSIKSDFWGSNLDEDNIYDDLTLENLYEAYNKAQMNAEEGYKTLIILDDVQKNLKGENENLLLHMVNNRRHAHLCIWIAAQNYFSLSKQVRQALTDLFIFKVNKTEMENIFNEQVEIPKEKFNMILDKTYKKPNEFIYINPNSQKIFYNWDEIIL